MRVTGRDDVTLTVGLTLALLVLLSGPVSQVLDDVRGIADASVIRLLLALVILVTVFVFHQLQKRQTMRDQADAAARAAVEATQRATEMSRLVAFSQALAASMDMNSSESPRDVALAHVPLLAAGRRIWVMTRTRDDQWDSLVNVGESSTEDRERLARQALAASTPRQGVVSEICFPMVVAGAPQGVLAVAAEPPLTEHQRSVLTTAAALLAVSLKNAQLLRQVRENSVRDGLTGCFSRSHALETLDGEIRRGRRSKLPLSLIMFDLDNFKMVNDRYGHLAGDAVLSAVGARMKTALRGSDLKCRYGGDEFMVILPDTPLAGATQVAENLRTEIESHPITWNEGHISVTASFGVASVASTDGDPLAAIARADAALYQAKQSCRNGVRVQALALR